jgi:hypothetical protein
MLETVNWLTYDICKKRIDQEKSEGWYKIDSKTFMTNTPHRDDAVWSQMIDRDRHYCSGECLRKDIKILTELPY